MRHSSGAALAGSVVTPSQPTPSTSAIPHLAQAGSRAAEPPSGSSGTLDAAEHGGSISGRWRGDRAGLTPLVPFEPGATPSGCEAPQWGRSRFNVSMRSSPAAVIAREESARFTRVLRIDGAVGGDIEG
jgi:hypothetical protein